MKAILWRLEIFFVLLFITELTPDTILFTYKWSFPWQVQRHLFNQWTPHLYSIPFLASLIWLCFTYWYIAGQEMKEELEKAFMNQK